MKLHVYKYQGAGNDFVIIDNRDGSKRLSTKQVNRLCDRRFGIGSDGFMMLGKSKRYDFSMRYFNSDGKEGTMCGNGGRCIVAFAYHMGLRKFEFEAVDGYHKATLLKRSKKECIVRLKITNVDSCPAHAKDSYFLNTGSPHYVEFVKDVADYPVDEKGKYWRYFFEGGTNVNFIEDKGDSLDIRTYERGVEAETFACGTGATASAIAAYKHGIKPQSSRNVVWEDGKSAKIKGRYVKYDLNARGGKLSVEFIALEDGRFRDIYLTGPATFSFECDIEI